MRATARTRRKLRSAISLSSRTTSITTPAGGVITATSRSTEARASSRRALDCSISVLKR